MKSEIIVDTNIFQNFFKLVLVVAGLVGALVAQQADDTVAPEQETEQAPEQAEVDTESTTEAGITAGEGAVGPDGLVKIEDVLVEAFENSDLWFGGMWIDDGIIQVRRIFGGPEELRAASDANRYVLGAKVNFLRRYFSDASINPPTLIRLPGLVRKLSVWVSGRSKNHTLYASVRDMQNRRFRIEMGKLDFTGWRKLEAVVPSEEVITQQDSLLATQSRPRGLIFEGFVIEFDAFQTRGTFYVYLDNFQAETDVYLEEEDYRREKTPIEERTDPIDDW